MKIGDIIQQLEFLAPTKYQEEYDNSGLITGDRSSDCTGVMVSLDCTEELVIEARRKNCNLIVSHHPLIFRPVRQVTPGNPTGRCLIAAIRNEMAIYAIHTNLDNVMSGVNASIADKLALVNREILLPRAGSASVGSGLTGDLEKPVSEKQLLKELKEKFGTPVIRHSPLTGQSVSRIAICGGAGSFLIPNALQAGAGFFISADIRYHEFFENEGKMVIADIGHYESEQYTVDLLHDFILEKFRNFAVLKSGTLTNPVNYYI
jgi:dinuclear metal center YbgI/SA1388 family protein